KAADFDAAVAAYHEIADDSTYREKTGDTWPLVKRNYVNDHLRLAKAAQAAHKCAEARQQVEAVLLQDEANQEAQEIARHCSGGETGSHGAQAQGTPDSSVVACVI